jgi:transketolase
MKSMSDMTKESEFEDLLIRARRRLLQMHFEAGVGHIGGNLSCLDAMLYVHHHVLAEGDMFVLSKGHSVGALYVTLWTLGRLSDADLCRFHRDGTTLAAHPAGGWSPNIVFSTGSLGHGLSLAAGVALGKRLKGEPGRVFCLCSDGEWQEGSTWEALTFARHHGLESLTVLIDGNGLQGFGDTQSVASMADLGRRIAGFGVNVTEIDGHDLTGLSQIGQRATGGPQVFLMRTIKGKGVPFMENRMEWHYLPMTADQYAQACGVLTAP